MTQINFALLREIQPKYFVKCKKIKNVNENVKRISSLTVIFKTLPN